MTNDRKVLGAMVLAFSALLTPCTVSGVRSCIGERKHDARVEVLKEGIRKGSLDLPCVAGRKLRGRLMDGIGDNAGATASFNFGQSLKRYQKNKRSGEFAVSIDRDCMFAVGKEAGKGVAFDYMFSYWTILAPGAQSWKPAAMASLSGLKPVQTCHEIIIEECVK
ncbi:MAG: hypothetical protein V1827_01565 [Candidatus Micrarchaeota archaeon]